MHVYIYSIQICTLKTHTHCVYIYISYLCICRHISHIYVPPFAADPRYSWTDSILGTLHAFKTAKVKVIPDQPSIQEKGLKSDLSAIGGSQNLGAEIIAM